MPDQVFGQRYHIVRHVARGGMAEVYLAHDELLDRPVALKVLFPEYSSDHSFVERFRREARAAANLNHPNIVSVYDWGEEGSTYFIVMEFLEGETLRELIVRNRHLSPKQAAQVGAEIAAGLAFAHRNGVIHRDIKPGNVIISPTGTVKVTDFGIARAGDPAENLTQTGSVMGTATYFSPEQAQGRPIDTRSDLYSLGVVLYEMTIGKPPFTGENPVAIAYQHVREEPESLTGQNARIPADFEAIVLMAMAKDPDNRYQTAEDLRADLLRFREDQPVMAVAPLAAETTAMTATRVSRPVADGTSVLAASTAATMGAEGGRRRNGAYVGLLVALLAGLGIMLFLLARSLGVGQSAAKVAVPGVVGLPEAEAVHRVELAHLKADRQPEANDTFQAGSVFEQDPKPGSTVAKGGSVTLKVSQGPAPGKVPSVIGFRLVDAADTLRKAGFRVSVTRKFDPSPSDEVLDQSPRAGDDLAKDATVRLTVSRGPQPTVPTSPPTTPNTEPPQTQPPDTSPPVTRPPRTTTTSSPDLAP